MPPSCFSPRGYLCRAGPNRRMTSKGRVCRSHDNADGARRSVSGSSAEGGGAVAVGAAAVVLAGAGVTYAATDGVRPQPGRHRVRQRDPGLRRPDHPAARGASGDPAGQVHGLDGQPGRSLPRGHQHRPVGRAADLRPAELQAHLVGRQRGDGQPEVQQRHRRAGRSDVLAERQDALDSGADRPEPFPGQQGRHARHAGHRLDPDRERSRRSDRPDRVLARQVHAVRGGQRPEHRRGARSQHGCDPAHVERRHRPA